MRRKTAIIPQIFPYNAEYHLLKLKKCLLTLSPHRVFIMTIQVLKTIVQTVALARPHISPIV